MRTFRSRLILSIFLLAVFAGSTVFGVSRNVSAAAPTDLNPASTQVNPVSPVTIGGFKVVGSLPTSATVLVTVAVPLLNLGLASSLEAAISNPQSPDFRHFLSQQTIQQDFLPVAQYQSTLSYLQSHDFTIWNTAEDSIIVASATVAQMQSSLGLSFQMYSNGTASYYSAFGSPTLSGIYVYSSNATILLVNHPSITVGTQSATGMVSQIPQNSEGVPNVTSPIEGIQMPSLLSTYNAASLVANGDNGKGKTIGIFEFGGTPYMSEELQEYDSLTGLANPPSFTTVPVGPYDPNLGTAEVEEELDVEASHAMAPGASIIVYVGNDALNWAPIIAVVDEQDAVNVLTQSWLLFESLLSNDGPGVYDFNVLLGDQYFLLGSLEGITFSAASGDRGAVGYAGQPLGSQSWPATSPYVTAVGGTQTYLTFDGTKVVSSKQTAWSNYPFEPNQANYGGSTGGVDALEPKPWYQDGLATPASYPNGRLVPDLSLQAALFPASYVLVDSREVSSSTGYTILLVGGTSESTPLLAGLVCDIDTAIGGSLGLINPFIYQVAQSSSYTKYFTPITYGFNGAWVDSSGYNLVNGWGAPNIGAWAQYFETHSPGSAPSLQVSVSGGEDGIEFAAGQTISVSATPVSGTTPTSDTYSAQLVTLQGTVASATLDYNSVAKAWQGTITVPSEASGESNVQVSGTVSGQEAFGFAQAFTSYLAVVETPFASEVYGTAPWSTQFGIPINLVIYDLFGNQITTGSYGFTASSYNTLTNKYSPIATKTFANSMGTFSSTLTGNYPLTPVHIVLNGLYGFISFQNGVGLLSTFTLSQVNSQPGTVSPGQYLQVQAAVQAPENTPNIISEETGEPLSVTIEQASTIVASLVSPAGKVVSSVNVGADVGGFLGELPVPASSASGIYTVWLKSSYQSIDLDGAWVNGTYFGKVFVAPQTAIVPKIKLSPNPVGEGQNVQITANIQYANGQEVTYGMFSATLYPAYDSNNYATYSALPAGAIPLWYNPSMNRWVGDVVMPSKTSLGWIGGETYFNQGLYPGIVTTPVKGPWDAYVSGESWNGVPTTTDESAQQGFKVGAGALPATPSYSRSLLAPYAASAFASAPGKLVATTPFSAVDSSVIVGTILAAVASLLAVSTVTSVVSGRTRIPTFP